MPPNTAQNSNRELKDESLVNKEKIKRMNTCEENREQEPMPVKLQDIPFYNQQVSKDNTRISVPSSAVP